MNKILISTLLLGSLHAFAQVESNTTTTTDANGNEVTTTRTVETREMKPRLSAGGLFVEPMISTSRTDADLKTSLLSDSNAKSSSIGLGAKLGIHASEVVFVGADARYAKTKIEESSYDTAEGDAINYGPTIGVQMPIAGLRLFGTYVMGGSYNPAAGANGLDLNFKDPRGSRAGLGLHVAAVSINLEYEDLTYDKTDVEALGPINVGSSTGVDFNQRGYTLSLSFPVEL